MQKRYRITPGFAGLPSMGLVILLMDLMKQVAPNIYAQRAGSGVKLHQTPVTKHLFVRVRFIDANSL